MIDELNEFIYQWDIEDFLKKTGRTNHIAGEVFLEAARLIANNFYFKPLKVQTAEDQSKIIEFREKTEWVLDSQDRSINIFYPIDCSDLGLYVVYKDKSEGIQVKKNKIYAIPYWMTYQFLSHDKDTEQKVLNFWFWTSQRLQKREKDIWW